MLYQNVCLENLAYTLPDEIVSSAEIESRLRPLYERLRLPEGRLELMTGIRERRFWPAGMLPSVKSIETGEKALHGVDRAKVGALVHASVCRDYLEPATACRVHHALGLPNPCAVYDVSNACLGMLNGMLQVANMIELGQIEAGLIVGTEGSRQLVETTIDALNADRSLTRDSVKLAVASLTIGSASAAILLTHRSISRSQNRLLGGVAWASTEHHQLCHSGRDEAACDMAPLMETDSERLMHEGIATGRSAFAAFCDELGWSPDAIDKSVCHQVGLTHRKLMLQSLGLPAANDFATVEYLGNTGSAALPVTLAIAAEQGCLSADDHVALLGIGSGINCIMLGVQWQKTLATTDDRPTSHISAPHRKAPQDRVVIRAIPS
jgi:3-oxoacyl-[acyl-carrier-protein] synthase-3